MKGQHPKVMVFFGGRMHLVECDCNMCVDRSPVARVFVLLVVLATYALVAWAVF
jgi:hypothetical protein